MNTKKLIVASLLVLLVLSACNFSLLKSPDEILATNTPAASPTPIVITSQPPTSVVRISTATPTPAAACREEIYGKWDDTGHDYDNIQIDSEFVDADHFFTIRWERGITLSEWLVQQGGGKVTEIVGVVRTSITQVQFKNPRSGFSTRLCAWPDTQLAADMDRHAKQIAHDRDWLKVYNIGDLWMSLQTGDPALIALIKCITPSTQGIPECLSQH